MSAGAGIRVLREQDQATVEAMPSQLNGRMSHGQVASGGLPGRSERAAEVVARAKLLSAPQWGKGPDGESAQVLIRYPDGECLYRQGERLLVGRVLEE